MQPSQCADIGNEGRSGGRGVKFCLPHWERLRAAINERGLTSLIARGGAAAAERTTDEFKGTATDATYDPLMACHWMITNRALEGLGLYVLTTKEDGSEYCPICEVLRRHPDPCPNGCTGDDVERYFINGPADAALEYVKRSPVLCAVLGWEAPPA